MTHAAALMLRGMSLTFFLLLSPGTWANQVITVNRYDGFKDFSRSRVTRFVEAHDGFRQEGSSTISEQFSCSEVLTLHQHFALGQMVSRQFLEPQDALDYRNFLLRFEPAQIVFLQLTDLNRTRSPTVLPGAHPVEQLLASLAQPVDATLALIAGQYVDSDSGKIRTTPLPWQLEPQLRSVAESFDRNRYKFVWEWGRGAASGVDIDVLGRRALLIQLQEMASAQIPLEDGWITFHSLDKVHTRAYLRRFPGRTIHQSPNGESIFLVPISEAVSILKPQLQSPTLRKLVQLGLTPIQAMELVQTHRSLEVTDFDVRVGGNPSSQPVTLMNLSDLHARMISILKLPPEIEQVLHTTPPDDWVVMNPHDRDYTVTPWTAQDLARRNAILLTNLDPIAAKADPDYVLKLMVSLLSTLYRELADYDPDARLFDFLSFMTNQEIQLVISTRDLTIAEQLRRLGTIEEGSEVVGAQVLSPAQIAAGISPSVERHFRFSTTFGNLIGSINVDPQMRDWFNFPPVKLSRGKFWIQRLFLGSNGL